MYKCTHQLSKPQSFCQEVLTNFLCLFAVVPRRGQRQSFVKLNLANLWVSSPRQIYRVKAPENLGLLLWYRGEDLNLHEYYLTSS